jgi:hypothetical protein
VVRAPIPLIRSVEEETDPCEPERTVTRCVYSERIHRCSPRQVEEGLHSHPARGDGGARTPRGAACAGRAQADAPVPEHDMGEAGPGHGLAVDHDHCRGNPDLGPGGFHAGIRQLRARREGQHHRHRKAQQQDTHRHTVLSG